MLLREVIEDRRVDRMRPSLSVDRRSGGECRSTRSGRPRFLGRRHHPDSYVKSSCIATVSPSIPSTSAMLVTLRVPSPMRAVWMMTSIAKLICWRMARVGRLKPGHLNHHLEATERNRAPEFAWMVEIDPSWPVFIACSMSSDSAPRTSPMTMRSGRMRRLLRSKSRCGDLAAALDVRRAASRGGPRAAAASAAPPSPRW